MWLKNQINTQIQFWSFLNLSISYNNNAVYINNDQMQLHINSLKLPSVNLHIYCME